MKQDNRRTLSVGFTTHDVTEEEIQREANTMKNGKAYLFKDEENFLSIRNERYPSQHIHKLTFIKKIIL